MGPSNTFRALIALAIACCCAGGSFSPHARAQDAATDIDAANRTVVQLLSQGQREQALTVAADTLKRALATLGEQHRDTRVALQNYAFVLQGLGRAAEALPHYERALKLNTELLGAVCAVRGVAQRG